MTDPAGPPAGRRGTSMSRARNGILAGAARCLVRYGTRKTTMGDIAREGGVAKATLYNHFRAKPEVYAALLAREVEALLAELSALPGPAGTAESVREAVAFAAVRVSEHPVLRALAVREPDVAVALAVPGDGAAWAAVRRFALHRVSLAQAAGALHPRHDAGAVVDTLLRWVLSHLFWPQPAAACAAAAYELVHGLLAPPYAAPHQAGAEPMLAGQPGQAPPYAGSSPTPAPAAVAPQLVPPVAPDRPAGPALPAALDRPPAGPAPAPTGALLLDPAPTGALLLDPAPAGTLDADPSGADPLDAEPITA